MNAPADRPRPRRHVVASVAVASAAVSLTSCGGGSTAPADTIPADAVVIAGDEFSFVPGAADAPAGSFVLAFVNEGRQKHTLLVLDADNSLIGDRMRVEEKGDVALATYELAPGTYTIVCDVIGHIQEGMVGTLTVG